MTGSPDFKIQISGILSTEVHEINKEYRAPLINSPDRVERGEVYERIWKRVVIGELKLPEGKQYIGIRLPEIREACDFEWKALYLEMVQK